MAGVGTLFPDEAGTPRLHLHAAFGRDDHVSAGCIRKGVTTWVIGEAVIIELVGSDARRAVDPGTGFELLELCRRARGREAPRTPRPCRAGGGRLAGSPPRRRAAAP